MYKSIFKILMLFSLMGCHLLDSGSDIPTSIKTDKIQYNLTEDDSVKVTITNNSSEIISYSTCFGKTIEVIKDEKILKSIRTPVCLCICPAELKPGETIPVHLSSLSTETFKSQENNLLIDESITYRIRYSLYYDEAFGDEPLPLKYSQTNRFFFINAEKIADDN